MTDARGFSISGSANTGWSTGGRVSSTSAGHSDCIQRCFMGKSDHAVNYLGLAESSFRRRLCRCSVCARGMTRLRGARETNNSFL